MHIYWREYWNEITAVATSVGCQNKHFPQRATRWGEKSEKQKRDTWPEVCRPVQISFKMKVLLYDIHQGRLSKKKKKKELVRSDKVWLFQTQLFHFIVKVLDESEVRDLCSVPIVYHTKLGKSFLWCLLCVQWRRHVEKGEVLPKQLPHKIMYRQLNWN